jgi:hypothetical protein
MNNLWVFCGSPVDWCRRSHIVKPPLLFCHEYWFKMKYFNHFRKSTRQKVSEYKHKNIFQRWQTLQFQRDS